MISPWLAILSFLAAARITRIITRDSITQPLRTWLVNRLGIDSKWSELLQCDWCMGVWVATAVTGAAWAWGGHWWIGWPMYALAAAQVTGWLASREGDGA